MTEPLVIGLNLIRLVQRDLRLQKRIASPLWFKRINPTMWADGSCESDCMRSNVGACLDNMVARLNNAREEGRLLVTVLAIQGERLTNIDFIEVDQKIAMSPG